MLEINDFDKSRPEDARTPETQALAQFQRSRAASSLGPQDRLLTGGIAVQSSDGIHADRAANSIYALGPGGRIVGRYDKAHLVPYGEYLPMRPLMSAIGLSRLAPGDEDFTPGFLVRHQEKLLFGSDCEDAIGSGEKCQGAQILAAIRRFAPSQVTQGKILRENAKKLLKL